MDIKRLAVIHILKKELGLSDEAYRDILQKAAGVHSAKDLDEAGFRKLMRYFVRSKHYRTHSGGVTLRQKYFIVSLSRQLGWEAEHFTNFLHKYYHKENVDHLTRKEASKVIESLKHIKEHQRISD